VPRIWRAVVQPAFQGVLVRQFSPAARREGEGSGAQRGERLACTAPAIRWPWSNASHTNSSATVRDGMRSGPTRTVWMIDWFTHPDFLDTPLAVEAITATGDLTFAALGAQKVYAGLPSRQRGVRTDAQRCRLHRGDPGRKPRPLQRTSPRLSSLYEMRRVDWKAIRREHSDHTGAPSLALLGRALVAPPRRSKLL